MKKRVFGNVLIILGVLMVLASLGLTMYNLYEDDLAGSRTVNPDTIVSLDTLSDSYRATDYIPDYRLDESFEMPVVNIDGGITLDVLIFLSWICHCRCCLN